MVFSGEDMLDEVATDKLQHEQSSDSGNHSLQQNLVIGTHALQSDHEISTPITSPVAPDTGHSQRSDQERSMSSLTSEKASETTDIVIHALETGQEGSIPKVREKVSEDGYNWRKYGQKHVRGNEFVRSYYKCTHTKCQAKKQLDCTHNGQIAGIVSFGDHCHSKVPSLPLAVGIVVSVQEKPDDSLTNVKDKSPDAHGHTPCKIEPTDNPQISFAAATDDGKDYPLQSNKIIDEVDNDDRPGSKRRKKENYNTKAPLVERPTSEHHVVQTLSEVDFVNDGYRWRKYGQKLVKGNPNPRNYYRCSNSGCPAKKHVERASHDPKLVITSYEGRHDHDVPPSRTFTHNVASTKSSKTANSGEPTAKLEESDAVSLDNNVHSSSDPRKDGEPKTKSKVTAIVSLDKVEQSILDPESKSNRQMETKSELNGTTCHATTCPEKNHSEQEQTRKAEAVRS